MSISYIKPPRFCRPFVSDKNRLTKRERAVLALLAIDLTLEEIAEDYFKVTRERIRQIAVKAIRKVNK